MKKPGGYYFFLVASAILFANAGFSQDAVFEQWPGTLKRDGKQKEIVTFRVRISDDGPFILRMTYADTIFEFKKQDHDKDSFTFDWAPGESDASCNLRKRESGDFKGDCELKNSSKKIEMQIIPPSREVSDGDSEAPVVKSKKSKAAPEKEEV